MAGPWEEFAPKPWEDYGKPGSIADFPNAPGFVSTVKRTAGQMLTTGATSIEDLTGPNAVTDKVRSVGQGIIDRNPAGIQSLSDIVESPWLTVKEAVGQFVPQIGAAAAGAAGGAAIGRRVAGAPGAAVGAGISSLVPIFSQEYGGIREDQKEGGQEDKGRALLAAGAATALERVGMGKLLKGIRGELPPMAKIPAEAAKGFAREGATEAAQTAIEQVGAFKDPTTSESMQKQALAGVMGGIGGGILGGVHAGAQKALGGTKKPSAETEQPAGETEQAPGATQPGLSETLAQVPPTPEAIRAQKLPETGPLTGAVNAGIEAAARSVEPPLSEDETAAALFHVESKRQDGTPQGARFAAMFDAGQISPREALEAFRLERSSEFTLPQPGVDAREMSLEEAAALAAPGADLEQSIPAGQATELPVDVVEPAPAIANATQGTPAPAAAPPQPTPNSPDAAAAPAQKPRTLREAQAQRAAANAAQQQQETASAPSPAQQPAAPGPAIAQQPASGPLTAAAQAAAAPAQPSQVAGEPAGGAVGPAGEVAAPGARGGAEPGGSVGAVGAAGVGSNVAGPVDQPAGSPAASRGPAEPVGGGVRADGALIEHVTKKGKTIRGVIRSDLTQDEAIAIDSGTFQKDGPNGRGYFIRERSLDKLAEHDARKAGGAPAITAAPSVAVPEQPGSATTTPPAPAAPTAPGEKWHYRSSDAGTPLREMPADRMKDAREVDGLVPGLRFLAHRDLGEGKTWSVTERTTGNTLTTGHTTRELAEFAAQQRVQQVGADKVRSVVREFLQKTGGLSEGEALAGTAEPRKGKVPGLDEVIAAYKRATGGGEMDANMNATAVHLHRALVDQNVKTVRDLAHPDNPASRRVIEQLSGKKLARGAMQSANIAESWMRSLHAKPVTPQVPAPTPNAAAPVSTQAPAQAGATAAAAPATPIDPVKRRAVLQALRDCLAA